MNNAYEVTYEPTARGEAILSIPLHRLKQCDNLLWGVSVWLCKVHAKRTPPIGRQREEWWCVQERGVWPLAVLAGSNKEHTLWKTELRQKRSDEKSLFLWLWIDPDPGTMPNSRGKKPLHSSCINSCVMSEGYRRGEFVWCGWKLTLCDWMSSRLSMCCLSLTVCFMRVLGDVKGTQVCPWTDYWTGLLGAGPGAPWYLGPLFDVTVNFSLQKSITRNYHKETKQLQKQRKQLQRGKITQRDKKTTRRLEMQMSHKEYKYKESLSIWMCSFKRDVVGL